MFAGQFARSEYWMVQRYFSVLSCNYRLISLPEVIGGEDFEMGRPR